MNKDHNLVFCFKCRKITEYKLRMAPVTKSIRNKDYEFYIVEAYCKKCGSEIGFHGLLDRNALEIDEQYRCQEGIITIPEIEELMQKYDLGEEALSLTLGFEKNTINRYLDGQIPAKERSDIMRKALTSRV